VFAVNEFIDRFYEAIIKSLKTIQEEDFQSARTSLEATNSSKRDIEE